MCPLCGMMPFLENLEKTDKEKPAKVRVFLLKFGGKKPAVPVEGGLYKKKGRGSAPGYMELLEVTEDYPEQVSKLSNFFEGRAIQFLEGLKK